MDEEERLKILAARKAVDAYRAAHAHLHRAGWHRGTPEEHTPLLEELVSELKKRGFISLDQFFDSSETLNIKTLGFASRADFKTRATPAELEALERMWH